MKRGRKSAAELALLPIASNGNNNRPVASRDAVPPPNHLQPATKMWWSATLGQWQIGPHQLRTLQAAGESWDRYQQAREALLEHGLTFEDAKGMIRARPECAIERDSRVAFMRCMRELDLADAEPPKASTRNSSLGITASWLPKG